ncbi:hypothetical protein NB640_04280 [Oxalobacter vibrioformis]|uniref:Phage integrase central domain-containing protein n=1 Tax=Oxalobacter vibrioformis TaxID=933080 RepID=A0A9E9LX56_9BURK|nr:hypothetical protein [Oxalobacter vibrioformis]WAW11375.1 hypothetical protein NB640_04280 [Oxalobacter vibrioformis]
MQREKKEKAAAAKKEKENKKKEQAENLTVEDLFSEWIENGVRRQDDNVELVRSFGADVIPQIGRKKIKELSEADLRNVLRRMVGRGVNRSAVVMRNNLVQMFGWGEKRQPWRRLMVDGNPADLLEIEKIVDKDYDFDNVRDRILSDSEIRELRDIFQRMEGEYAAAPDRRATAQPFTRTSQHAVWLMLATLCRVGELSMARWENVDFEKKEWFIPRKKCEGETVGFDCLFI